MNYIAKFMDEHEIYINQKFYVRWHKMPLVVYDIPFWIDDHYQLRCADSFAPNVDCDQILLGMLAGEVSVTDIYTV